VLLVFVTLAVYWNRFPCKFTVSSEGAGFEASTRQRNLNRIAMVLGALAGHPSVAGAGFLAQSKESLLMNWGMFKTCISTQSSVSSAWKIRGEQ